MFFLLFVGFFFILFLLSRQLTEALSFLFFRLTNNHTLAIQLLAFFFLPGVILHELAHWLVASLCFVPTGEIEFFPKQQGDYVKLGSVQVGKTDPFRRFLIGIAPSFVGVTILFGLFWFLQPSTSVFTWKTVLFVYAVFEIGNTMFSSKKDLEGIVIFLILMAIVLLLLIFLQVPIFLLAQHFFTVPFVESLFRQLCLFFLIAMGMDAIVVICLQLLLHIRRR